MEEMDSIKLYFFSRKMVGWSHWYTLPPQMYLDHYPSTDKRQHEFYTLIKLFSLFQLIELDYPKKEKHQACNKHEPKHKQISKWSHNHTHNRNLCMHLHNPSKYNQTSGMGYDKLLWWGHHFKNPISYLYFQKDKKKKRPQYLAMWHVTMYPQPTIC